MFPLLVGSYRPYWGDALGSADLLGWGTGDIPVSGRMGPLFFGSLANKGSSPWGSTLLEDFNCFSCFILRFGSWRPPFLLYWCYCCLNTLHWLQLFSIPHVNISLVPIRGHYTPKSSGLSFCSCLTCLAHFWTHPSQQGWKHGSGFTSLWKGQLPAFKWVLVWLNITFWTKQPIWIQFGRSQFWSALKVEWNITVQGFVPFNPQQ